ncbi:MAG: polyprenyl synthetase family protein [Anaerolineae bacterium]|nr:polyprenyl synthetase family protein [Anaerolineae bacterium]
MTFQPYLERHLPVLETELRRALTLSQETFAPLYGMMQYHMGWLDERLNRAEASQGKRLRPVFCMLACEAVGGHIDRVLPAAAAIEILHNFSLIHDDIQDNSATRRHRKTVWTLWGLAHGINAGDAMFALSFLTLGQLQERGVPAPTILRAQRLFTETCIALTEGQYLDMDFETRTEIAVDEYVRMIRNKTAALIACAMRLGALIGGADEETAARYAGFGENLGLAFQVIDDVLGIWGDESHTGKSTSLDILARKKTLPVIYALDVPDLRAFYAQETLTEQDVARAVDILERRGARAFATQIAQEFADQAVECLAGMPTSPAHQAILDLGQSLLGRKF